MVTVQDDAIVLNGKTLEGCRHLCAFFNSRDEEYGVFLPFIREGLARGEKGIHIVDARLRQDHLRRLAESGIDVDAAAERHQLEVLDWEEAYLRDGRFDQQAMLTLIEELLTATKMQGFRLARLVAHMEWAREDRPGVDDIVEYETRLNYVLPKYPDPVICTYDLGRFDAGVVIDILRTHPAVIIGGIVQENPFYVPPDVFLQELAARRARISV
ncbi:MEDS domain-containing protein [Candidatus Nitrospira bockiana]